jgi:non-specific serine/threonine protein kinase
VLDRLVHDNQGTVFMPLGLLLRNAFSNSGMNDILSQTQKAKLRMDCEWSWLVADAYSTMGNKDESIDWLEHIVQRGFINYPILSQYDPFLENIRNESRFQRLMAFTKDEWDKVNIGIDDFFDSST